MSYTTLATATFLIFKQAIAFAILCCSEVLLTYTLQKVKCFMDVYTYIKFIPACHWKYILIYSYQFRNFLHFHTFTLLFFHNIF